LKRVIGYLIAALVFILLAFVALRTLNLPDWIAGYRLAAHCSLVAALGGVLYCLRSVYLNRCVHNRWSEEWEVWYYLRPLASAICGIVAYLFLKAGLVVLDAKDSGDDGNFGYLAFAFFAGLNVDKFVAKIEELGQSLFGIEKSRNAKSSDPTN
jgi:hypothetical protein